MSSIDYMETKRYILRDASIRNRLKVKLDAMELNSEKPFEVLIRPYKKNRSLAQNNLMWKWLTVIANHLRDEHGLQTTDEDLKSYYQSLYLGIRAYEMPGKTQPHGRIRGTSELNTAEFTEFLNRIEVYANAELGINLPHPEDIYYEALGINEPAQTSQRPGMSGPHPKHMQQRLGDNRAGPFKRRGHG